MKRFKLAIASGKGGVGKSMLSSVLAVLFSDKKKIVAVDCDVDAPNLAIWLNEGREWKTRKKVYTSSKAVIDYRKCTGCGLCADVCRFRAIKMVKGKPVINPFLCEGCAACKVVCPQKAISLKKVRNGEIKIKKTKHGFYLIAGQLVPGETGSGKIVAQLKQEAEKIKHDLAIIDSAPGTGCPVIASLQGVDYVVLITEPTPSGVSDLKRTLEVVSHFGINWGLVINKWDVNPDLTQKIEKEFKSRNIGKISYDKDIFKMKISSKIRKEIDNIFKHLLTIFSA